MAKIKEDKNSMFLAMRDIFYGGEFSNWLDKQTMPAAAMKEFEEAEAFFMKETGFDKVLEESDEHCKLNTDCSHCSEKAEKTIHRLFYEKYSSQFQESAGEFIDGKVTLHFHNQFTEQSLSATLNENGELVVEKR